MESSETATGVQAGDAVESMDAVVAADDARCSEIGASFLRAGGHAVDAAVAAAHCLGVVYPMASGVGGGGFMVVRSAATSQTEAIDFRETAPLAASEVLISIPLECVYLQCNVGCTLCIRNCLRVLPTKTKWYTW